jgi:hypothetical protein
MTGYPLEPDARSFEHLTEACVAFVRDHLASIGRQPASYLEDSSDLRRSFREPIPENGHAIEAILARLAPAIAMSFNTAGPGYFGFIPGGGIYSAALADFVALATNRYVGVARAAPALAEIEMQVVRWQVVCSRRAGRWRTSSPSSPRGASDSARTFSTGPSTPRARRTSRSPRQRAWRGFPRQTSVSCRSTGAIASIWPRCGAQ